MNIQRQFALFALVGVAGTATQYALLWTLAEIARWSPPLASGAGYVAGSVVNYLLNYSLTFSSDRPHADTMVKYYAVVGTGLAVNTGLMHFFCDALAWNYWLAQLTATGFGLGWNFLGSRWWAFSAKAARANGER